MGTKEKSGVKERSEKVRIADAVEVAIRYGQISGDHHKAWVIDQMLRKLLGKDYERTIKESDPDGEYDPWDVGIAP